MPRFSVCLIGSVLLGLLLSIPARAWDNAEVIPGSSGRPVTRTESLLLSLKELREKVDRLSECAKKSGLSQSLDCSIKLMAGIENLQHAVHRLDFAAAAEPTGKLSRMVQLRIQKSWSGISSAGAELDAAFDLFTIDAPDDELKIAVRKDLSRKWELVALQIRETRQWLPFWTRLTSSIRNMLTK